MADFARDALRTYSGFVTEEPLSMRRTLYFWLGHPPAKFAMPSLFLRQSFDAHEFVVVAAQRSLLPWCDYVALAYRRVGAGDASHGASQVVPWLGILVSLEALVLTPLATHPHWQSALLDTAATCVGVGCILRLRAIRAARRLLLSWQPP